MAWRLARSLDVLRAEVRARHPGTRVDTIGDQSHASGASDHNPNPAGVVCAADFFGDRGLDLAWFAGRVASTRHPAVKYVIYNRRIWSRSRAADGWRPYYGSNPHATHVHVSVGTGPDGRSTGSYDDTTPWGIAPKEDDDMALTEAQAATQTADTWRLDALLANKPAAVYTITRNGKSESRTEPNKVREALDVLGARLGELDRVTAERLAEVASAVQQVQTVLGEGITVNIPEIDYRQLAAALLSEITAGPASG